MRYTYTHCTFLSVNLKFPKAPKWVKTEYCETAREIEPRNKRFQKIVHGIAYLAKVFKKALDEESRDFTNALKSVVGIETVSVIAQVGNKSAHIMTVAKQNKRWFWSLVLLKEQLVGNMKC